MSLCLPQHGYGQIVQHWLCIGTSAHYTVQLVVLEPRGFHQGNHFLFNHSLKNPQMQSCTDHGAYSPKELRSVAGLFSLGHDQELGEF